MNLKNYNSSQNDFKASNNAHLIQSLQQLPSIPSTSRISLRPYQVECLAKIKELHAQGKNRLLVSLPTASGKTVIFAHLITKLSGRALIIAHTHELLQQAEEKLIMIAPDIYAGFVDGEHKDFGAEVVIASVQSASLDSNLNQLSKQNFGILIYDECHHAATDSARKIIDRLGFGKKTNKLLVGFTATAWRQDKKGLGEIFDTVAYEKDTKSMIDEGWLVPPVGYKIATDIDLSSVQSVDGDFVQASLARVMDTQDMCSKVVEAYIQKASGRKAICFGVSVNHAKNLADGFNARGVVAKVIHGEMTLQEREAVLENYRSGSTQVLCNCQILTEGVDLPETSCVIVARPTKSLGLYVQMVGRGLRLWPNKKDCVVLDVGDRHHSICNAAMLLSDSEKDQIKERTKKEMLRELPVKLNPKLKAVLVSSDPLGQSFTWERGDNNAYFMRGAGKARIDIVSFGKDTYAAIYSDEESRRIIAENLNFEWAFSTAEDYAKVNRKLFVLSDKEAEWRELPITDKQIKTLRKCGFKSGVDKLTRGQASAIMQSGVLWRR